MSVMDQKRYYWLKLNAKFFHRHDIRIIESMENGKDYLLFYLKMLCEATSHDGELRFSEKVPYTDSMLATVTNTNIDIVKAAINIFTELGLMEICEDLTIKMTELPKIVGSETHGAKRKRLQRGDKGGTMSHQCPTNVPQLSPDCRTEKEKEIEKEIDIELEIEREKEKENEVRKILDMEVEINED